MKAPRLQTSNPSILLVEPDIERDAPISTHWLEGEVGRNTLSLMGVTPHDNLESSIEKERERVQDFIERKDQLNWMIEIEGNVIGSIWVDLEPVNDLSAPAVHIMIGNPAARGRGAGSASIEAVIDYLHQNGEKSIYSRHLAKNEVVQKLLEEKGFVNLGDPYTDSDGLEWQNVILDLK